MNKARDEAIVIANTCDRVYFALKNDIASGKAQKNGRIMPEPELGRSYDVSIGTIRKAVGRLVDEGILERQQGRGTFVIDNPELVRIIDSLSSSKHEMILGQTIKLLCQDEIDPVLFGGDNARLKKKVIPVPLSKKPSEMEEWADCDIVQLSPLDMQLPGGCEYFLPVPKFLKEQLRGDVSESIIDECSSLDGELLMLPYVANPGLFYAYIPAFEDAGMPLPVDGWSWDDFLNVCEKLKRAGHMPFGYQPPSGCFFEHILYQAGGDYFDAYGKVSLEREAFDEMISFLKTMHDKEYSVNLYNIPQNYLRFLRNGGACMTTVGPLLGYKLEEKSSEWTFLPMPSGKAGNMASSILIGFGVPSTCSNPAAAWELLAKVFSEDGRKKMGSLPMVYPALNSCRKSWKCAGVKHPEIARHTAENSKILPSRKGHRIWQKAIVDVFIEAMESEISCEDAWKKARCILKEMQTQPGGILTI